MPERNLLERWLAVYDAEGGHADIASELRSVAAETRHLLAHDFPLKDTDWTVDPETGRCNSSPEFLRLKAEIGLLIRSEAHALIRGGSDQVAGFILAQLAHAHGLAPTRTTDLEPGQ